MTFDGQPLAAFAGDTLASALLASGVARDRPFGDAGPARAASWPPASRNRARSSRSSKPFPDPMLTATDGRGGRRAGAPAACTGRAGWPSDAADPHAYDAVHHHCEVVVVGAGPAGLAAALTAGRRRCPGAVGRRAGRSRAARC